MKYKKYESKEMLNIRDVFTLTLATSTCLSKSAFSTYVKWDDFGIIAIYNI